MYNLTNAIKCADLARKLWEKDTIRDFESSYAFFIDPKCRYRFHEMINKGLYKRTDFNLRSTAKYAFNTHCDDVVIIHNHTGHDATPSENDLEFANYITSSLYPFEIHVADFIIITEFNHYSLKEHNQIKCPEYWSGKIPA
jgi:DNA repair protein RadC